MPVILARLGLNGQQLPALGVKDEKQPVKKDEAVFVEARQVGVGDVIPGAPGEAVGEDFHDGEDSLAEIGFQLGLVGQGVFADLIEAAFALVVAGEGGGTEEGEENFEVFEGADGQLEVDGKEVAGLGVPTVEAPFVAIGEDAPI